MSWHALLGPLHRLPPRLALDDWFAELRARCEGGVFELAVLGGRVAATPGLAFLAGYQAALRRPKGSVRYVRRKTGSCALPIC